MSGRHLIVLRHGRTAWNVEQRYQGRDHPADPPLDAVGRDQAGRAATALLAWSPELIVASDSRRAQQTAAPLAAATGLPPVPEPRLREQSLGRWEGLTRTEVQQQFPEEYGPWAAGQDPTRAGGETREQVSTRAAAVVDALPSGVTAVLITHSATASALLARLLGLPLFPRRLGSLGNCRWSELTEQEGGWALQAHNTAAGERDVPDVRRRR